MKEAEKARKKNLVWLAVRITDAEDQQQIPSWTRFNIMSRSKELVSEDVIAYLPNTNAPATELTTVNEILRQSEDIRRRINLSELVVVTWIKHCTPRHVKSLGRAEIFMVTFYLDWGHSILFAMSFRSLENDFKMLACEVFA